MSTYKLQKANSNLRMLIVICLCQLSTVNCQLFSQTLYTGADNGDWFTASNWNHGLPATGNDATVPSGKTVVIAQALNVNFNIQSFGGLKNTAALTLATNLVSGGLITNAGTMTVNSGVQLTSSGGINNSGTITNNGTTNSNSVFTNALGGIVNNNSVWTQQAALINNGTFCNNAGSFICPAVFTNNNAVKNLAGAAFKIDQGGVFTNAVGSTLTNGGNFTNGGAFTNNTTVTNTGTFTNNGTHTCNGVFNNESGGTLASTATLDINGRINNKLGATITNGFNLNIKNGGYLSNAGNYTNSGAISVLLGGTFVNESTGVMSTNFGSTITDAGSFKNDAGALISGNGGLTISKRFDNLGSIAAANGSQITVNDSLINTGTITSANIFTNAGYVFNTGSIQNLAGGTFNNTKTVVNQKPGIFTNNFDYNNKSGATTTNNGTFIDNVRVTNDGVFTNNAYLLLVGDFLNHPSATLANTEVIEVNEGSILNEGSFSNTKSLYIDQCGVLSNKSTISNTGSIFSSGVVFQRGTISGNALIFKTGIIQTSATSDAPICRASLSTGTDLVGEAKVYGQNPILQTLGIDSCAGFQYFIDGVNRKVYTCAQVGQPIKARAKIVVRTGDSLTCNIPITVFDGIAPQITGCPQNVKILTANTAEKYTWTQITAVDNCPGTPRIVSTIASGSTFNLGITEVVITAFDASNNIRDCRFKVNVVQVPVGTGVPGFTNCPANLNITVPSGNAAAHWVEPTVTGGTLPIIITQTNVSGDNFAPGTTIVTYTATDANKKISSCSFSVTVTSGDICSNDNIKPVIQNCPANIFLVTNPVIISAVAIWKAPTASDNCGLVTLTSNYTSGTIFPVGTQTVVYTATDAKNNTSTCTFTINQGAINPCAGDVSGPVISGCPANITQNTTGLTGIVSWSPPSASDNCSPIITNADHQPGDNFILGTTTVNYQFSDKVGNLSKCTFNITLNNPCINDTLAPVLGRCPADISVLTVGTDTTAIVSWTNPTATDNCGAAIVSSSKPIGTAFKIGLDSVKITATDARGNMSSCTFKITVSKGVIDPCLTDVTPPVLVACPVNQTITTAVGSTTATATWINPAATDNCSAVTVVSSPVSGSAFNIGVNTITVTATDAKGNKSTCTFTVTVIKPDPCLTDVTPPVLGACPVNQTITAAVGSTTATATWINPTATDNCSTATVVSSPVSGSAFKIGANTITVTATDAKGNKSTCTFTITVIKPDPCLTDVTPPVLGACPANQTITAAVGSTTAIATWLNPTATDNCSTAIVVSSPVSGSAFNIGVNTITVTATDAKGNKSTCTFTITVIKPDPCLTDVTPPVLGACPVNQTITAAVGSTTAIATWLNPTATDNCSTATVVSSPSSGSAFNIGVNTVTVTATDAKGNKSTCTFTITVVKNTCVQPPTPQGWMYLGQYGNNFYYKFTLSDCNYSTAKSRAHSIGGKLLSPKDAAENNFIQRTITGNIWLGIERTAQSPSQNGGWKNADGATQTYFNWNAGEPNNYGGNPWWYNETVVQMYANGTWNDANEWTNNWTVAVLPCYVKPVCNVDFDAKKLYKIVNKKSGKCLDVSGASQNNYTNVIQWDYWGGENQKWSIVPTANGYSKLVAHHSGKVLTCQNNWNGANLYQHEDLGGNEKEWKIECTDKGYKITHHGTQRVCNLQNGCYWNGLNLQINDLDGSDGQSFDIVEVSSGNGVYLQNSKILTVTATIELNQARIAWLNNTGATNDFFQIEKMNPTTGDFETLQKAKSQTTTLMENYVAFDKNPTIGDNFYRIRVINLDGTSSISEVQKVNYKNLGARFSVFPNPADDVLYIDLEAYKGALVDIFIYNHLGQTVFTQQIEKVGSSSQEIDIQNQSTGNYLIRIVSKGKRDETKSFIISK